MITMYAFTWLKLTKIDKRLINLCEVRGLIKFKGVKSKSLTIREYFKHLRMSVKVDFWFWLSGYNFRLSPPYRAPLLPLASSGISKFRECLLHCLSFWFYMIDEVNIFLLKLFYIFHHYYPKLHFLSVLLAPTIFEARKSLKIEFWWNLIYISIRCIYLRDVKLHNYTI